MQCECKCIFCPKDKQPGIFVSTTAQLLTSTFRFPACVTKGHFSAVHLSCPHALRTVLHPLPHEHLTSHGHPPSYTCTISDHVLIQPVCESKFQADSRWLALPRMCGLKGPEVTMSFGLPVFLSSRKSRPQVVYMIPSNGLEK